MRFLTGTATSACRLNPSSRAERRPVGVTGPPSGAGAQAARLAAQRHLTLERRRQRAREQGLLRRERVAPGSSSDPPPAADQEPPHATVDLRQQLGDVGVGGRWERWNTGRAVGLARVYTPSKTRAWK